MSHSPEQNRKKEEARRMAEHHCEHSTVDGEKAPERFLYNPEMMRREEKEMA